MKPPVSNCCKGPKSDTETDFAIKSEEMDWEVRFEKEFQIRERVVDHTWDKFKNDVYPSEIKDFIREVRATAVKETEKAFGGCKKCYGKGYATYRHGTRTSADFIGDRSYTTPQETRMLFCVCERGKALEKLIQPK